MKTCTKCKQSKQLSEFNKNKNYKDGFSYVCRNCKKIEQKEYRLVNKETISIKRKLSIPTIHSIKSKTTSQRKWRRNNKEMQRENARRSDNKRRALKVSTENGTITKESLDKLLILQHKECHYCGICLDQTKQLDHYIPLSKGGPHSIDNVVWSCAKCNNHKRAKMPTTSLLLYTSVSIS